MRKVVYILPILCLAACMSAQPGARKTNEAYIRDLKSGDPALQREASKQLGANRSEGAIGPLSNLLNTSSDPEVQVSAAAALGEIGEPGRSTDALLKRIQTSDNQSVRYASLAALGGIGRQCNQYKQQAVLDLADQISKGGEDPIMKDLAAKVTSIYGAK